MILHLFLKRSLFGDKEAQATFSSTKTDFSQGDKATEATVFD